MNSRVLLLCFTFYTLMLIVRGSEHSRFHERLHLHSRRGVLIDLGANCGNSYMSFKEQFERQRRPELFTYYLFEPNPYLVEGYLSELGKKSTSIEVIQAAGWITNGYIDFYLDSNEQNKGCDPHSNKNPRGASSLFKDDYHPRSGKRITVSTVDMNEWMEAHVHPDDYCVLKVDIEGAEYELLRHLIIGGSMKLVDELYVEFHEPYTHKSSLQWLADAYPFKIIHSWH